MMPSMTAKNVITLFLNLWRLNFKLEMSYHSLISIHNNIALKMILNCYIISLNCEWFSLYCIFAWQYIFIYIHLALTVVFCDSCVHPTKTNMVWVSKQLQSAFTFPKRGNGNLFLVLLQQNSDDLIFHTIKKITHMNDHHSPLLTKMCNYDFL